MNKINFRHLSFFALSILGLSLLALRPAVEDSPVGQTGGLHFISFKQLVNYIEDFRNNSLSNEVYKLSTDGFVEASDLQAIIDGGAQGVVFHYCIGTETGAKPYLCFQACNDSSQVNILNGDQLYRSYSEQKSTNTSSADITAELIGDTITPSVNNSMINGNVARTQNQNFATLFGADVVTLAHGYFNASEVNTLISEKSSEHLHYYWGFDESETVNNLRLCFVGFNAGSNNNYILDSNTQSYYSFIERSWP